MATLLSRRAALLAGSVALASAARPALPQKGRGVSRDRDGRLAPRVLVLNFDPIIESEGGKRLNALVGFNDPHYLCDGYIADVRACSGGRVRYNVVEWRDLDVHPVKKDGFRYTDEAFLEIWRGDKSKHHQPDAIDYLALLREYDIERRVSSGDLDEVWLFSYPFTGTYESILVGPTACFCNSDPLTPKDGIRATRNFVIMGFNPERGVGEMLEDLGHRTESILTHVYGSWNPTAPKHAWDRFTVYDKNVPGGSACGNVHFAPNSTKDYEWGRKTYVLSSADDWLDYPRLTGKKRLMTASDWGNGDIRAHHRWWLERLPKAPGRAPDGKLASWWNYVVDFNAHRESSGS